MTDISAHLQPEITLDQQLALHTAATRLAEEFDASQMALGFFTHLAGEHAIAWSGGSEPGIGINPAAIAAMAERGIDISEEFPKPWTDEVVRAADVVVAMGCGDACPVFPGTRFENWNVEDPAGLDLAGVRPIRDEIERRVRRLLDELNVTNTW
ncbi:MULTISPECIES: arsenate reductase/protein-tyrosine-phosphatase family protein [unclassified Micromonospora]|uniref:arsenate reductase/protein-tyrosine-phosphatase family protein n=1 Tax=unclassified Micromonospora TaxID=2617518 RepID=UPI002FEECE58